MEQMKDIFVGDDKTHADTIRAVVKSLGHEIPSNWTDENVIEFFNTLSDDKPRIWTDMEKADMKYESQVAE